MVSMIIVDKIYCLPSWNAFVVLDKTGMLLTVTVLSCMRAELC